LSELSLNRKSFYKKVGVLVIPMALQNLINVGVNASDVIFLGKVGEDVLSGCSLAGQVFFVLSLFLFGVTSGACVLTAQYWGKKDTVSIEKLLGIVLGFSEIVGILFMVVSLAMPDQIMGLLTNDPAVIVQGSKFLRIVAFTYPIVAFNMSYLNMIKSVEKVIISTVVYAISLTVNIILNWILIFGEFGFPAMGIRGSATATLCARILELIIVLVYANKHCKEIRIIPKYILKMDKILLADFFRFSGPVIFNEVLWGLGYSVNAAIIGHLGSSAIAANSVAQVARQLSMVVVFGIATATAIMLGKAIGENKKELAQFYASESIKVALVGGVVGGLLIFIFTPFMISGLGFQGETAVYTKYFLHMMSYYVIGQALNSVWIVGIFRAGGDTIFGMVLDLTAMWMGSILFGALAAFVFKWSIPVVYFILLADELLKLPFSAIRYKQKKWLKNVTR